MLPIKDFPNLKTGLLRWRASPFMQCEVYYSVVCSALAWTLFWRQVAKEKVLLRCILPSQHPFLGNGGSFTLPIKHFLNLKKRCSAGGHHLSCKAKFTTWLCAQH